MVLSLLVSCVVFWSTSNQTSKILETYPIFSSPLIHFCSFSLPFFPPLCGRVEEQPKEKPEADPFAALPCDTIECDLPYCFCSHKGDKIPGGLNPQDVSKTGVGEEDGVGIGGERERIYSSETFI